MHKVAGYLTLVFVLLIFPGISTVNAHGLRELVPRLIESGLELEYVSEIFNNQNLLMPGSPTTLECKKIRQEVLEDVNAFRQKTLERGAEYYNVHKTLFDGAEQRYGVPAEYILAIIRTETYFGICLGDHYVLQTLYNIYSQTDDPRKRSFAGRQIATLLRVAVRDGWNTNRLFSLPGSHMGAFGLCHFIPTSYELAVDGDGDNVIDLLNPADAIFSIANYLVRRGWKTISPDHALFDYNPDREYVERVTKFAEIIRDKIKPRRSP